MNPKQVFEARVLVSAPTGRDGPVTCSFLQGAGLAAELCDLSDLAGQIANGVGVVLMAEEALLHQDVKPLMDCVAMQPTWSDLTFLVLTSDREAPAIATAREKLMATLRNVVLIERPVRPITLLSSVRSALRGRQRQYEVRSYLAERLIAERDLEKLVEERTRALASSNERLLTEMAERARAEESLRQSQKLEAIGQLTGGVAHDFNNLLTVISSCIDFLRRPDLPEKRRLRYVDAIRETTDRATAVTSQLLAFARRQPLKAEVFDANIAVSRTLDMLRTIVGSRVLVNVEQAGEPCFMNADISQLETALVNLAVNSRDAMNGEGKLIISVSSRAEIPAVRLHPGRRGPFVAVSVTDTGSGISADHIGRIFEPFYTTKEVGKGTGLGLSQVYGFAKQSGGDVVVESRLGEGTTFTLYLRHVESGAAPEVSAPAQTGSSRPQSGSVLVVEDNKEVGDLAVQLLADIGYETTLVSDAKSGFDMIEANPDAFDVVFSDVVTPGPMTGVDLAKAVRLRWKGLPVLLTTGYSEVLAHTGTESFHVLCKPYSVEALSKMLGELLGGKGESNEGEDVSSKGKRSA